MHRICNSCLENKLSSNFKGDNTVCNTCNLPDYVKAKNEREYQKHLKDIQSGKCAEQETIECAMEKLKEIK